MNTYCSFQEEEREKFAKTRVYIIKNIIEYKFQNVTDVPHKTGQCVGLVSRVGCVVLQRNDVNMRNEWNNYELA
jgi:hypothetical protein